MRGFSLVELLVAVAILGLAVVGLLHVSAEGTRATSLVEARVLAGIVAENQAAEAALAPAADLAVPADGVERAGDRDWRWRRSASPGPVEGLLRVEIAVTEGEPTAGDARVVATRTLLRGVR